MDVKEGNSNNFKSNNKIKIKMNQHILKKNPFNKKTNLVLNTLNTLNNNDNISNNYIISPISQSTKSNSNFNANNSLSHRISLGFSHGISPTNQTNIQNNNYNTKIISPKFHINMIKDGFLLQHSKLNQQLINNNHIINNAEINTNNTNNTNNTDIFCHNSSSNVNELKSSDIFERNFIGNFSPQLDNKQDNNKQDQDKLDDEDNTFNEENGISYEKIICNKDLEIEKLTNELQSAKKLINMLGKENIIRNNKTETNLKENPIKNHFSPVIKDIKFKHDFKLNFDNVNDKITTHNPPSQLKFSSSFPIHNPINNFDKSEKHRISLGSNFGNVKYNTSRYLPKQLSQKVFNNKIQPIQQIQQSDGKQSITVKNKKSLNKVNNFTNYSNFNKFKSNYNNYKTSYKNLNTQQNSNLDSDRNITEVNVPNQSYSLNTENNIYYNPLFTERNEESKKLNHLESSGDNNKKSQNLNEQLKSIKDRAKRLLTKLVKEKTN